jgi:hypothetical protein
MQELDYRSTDGIAVSLRWNRATDELTVTVADSRTGHCFEIPARKDNALDVFHHPFAYATEHTLDPYEPALAA